MTKKPTPLSKALVRTVIVLILLLVVFGLLKMTNII
jgi:hypothetical protein